MTESKIDECECCGFEPVEVRKYDASEITQPRYTTVAWYCELCAGTMASSFARHGHTQAPALAAICYVGNTILAQLKRNAVVAEQPDSPLP